MSLFVRACAAACALLSLLARPVCAAPPLQSPTPSAPVPFTFVAYGDTRSHPEDHRAVIAAIVRQRPEFVLQSGDLVDRGGDKGQWEQFDQITQPLRDAHIAYYPARGNHDVGPYYLKRITEAYDSGNGYYYAFTRHHYRFVMLDSLDPDEFDPHSAQYQWLVRELTRAHVSGLPFFVMFHEAPFSVGPHGPTPDAQRILHPLFVKYQPLAVFCGHDHLYYRTTRDGVTYFVTGGGGAPLYHPDNAKIAIPGDVYASVHHLIRCDVDGSRVTFTALCVDGAGGIPANRGATPTLFHVLPDGTHQATPLNFNAPAGAVLDKVTLGPK